jgi:Flp pilus assembly protein TadB
MTASGWVLVAVAVMLVPTGRPGRQDPSDRSGRQRWTTHGRPGGERDPQSLPVTLDLVAAALRSGRPLADALSLAAPAASAGTARALVQVATLVRLGAAPEQAWAAVPRDGPLGPVAAVAVRSAASGIKVAGGMERLAARIRADRGAAATARAHRAGVLALAPLAACFLPSFVCLGIVPVVVGMARAAFRGAG